MSIYYDRKSFYDMSEYAIIEYYLFGKTFHVKIRCVPALHAPFVVYRNKTKLLQYITMKMPGIMTAQNLIISIKATW